MMPSQKSGMLMLATTNAVLARPVRLLRVAATTPAGIPMASARPMARNVSSRVTGSRSDSSSVSGTLLMKSWPRSRRINAPSQVRYWSRSGWSRPSAVRMVATFSSVARKPSIVRTGSPGTSRIMRNTNRLMASRIGTVTNSRWTT